MKLFFALWPPEDVRLALAPHRLGIARVAGGRPITPVTMHMTLVYAGNVPTVRLLDMIAVGDRIQRSRFEMNIDTAGCFDTAKAAWLGSDTPPRALLRLQSDLQISVVEADFDVDARRFRPHVTITRNIEHHFEAYPVKQVVWPVDEFCLVRPISNANEIRYESIKVWPLL